MAGIGADERRGSKSGVGASPTECPLYRQLRPKADGPARRREYVEPIGPPTTDFETAMRLDEQIASLNAKLAAAAARPGGT